MPFRVLPTRRNSHRLAILHLRRDVQDPFASFYLIQSADLQSLKYPTAENPEKRGGGPDLGMFLDRTGESEIVDGLDDCAVHCVDMESCRTSTRRWKNRSRAIQHI